MKKTYFPFGRPQRPTYILPNLHSSNERIVGLEPTLFHIGSVMPYQLGEIRICGYMFITYSWVPTTPWAVKWNRTTVWTLARSCNNHYTTTACSPSWDWWWVDFNGFLWLFENHIPYICLITHIVTSWISSFSLVSYHIKTCQPLLGEGRFTNVIPMWSHSKLRFQNTYPLLNESWIKDSEYPLLIAVYHGFEPRVFASTVRHVSPYTNRPKSKN